MTNKEKYWLAKQAKGMKTYELSGEVQGVGLRKAVHQRLDQLKSEGLAVNNARNNNVYMTIPEDVSEDLLETIKLHVAERARERNTEYPEPESREVDRDDMEDVKLTPDQVRAFAKGQGLAQLAEKEDAAIARWMSDRYRLSEGDGVWEGRVPALARKQMYAEEPIYQGQLETPEDFGEFAWNQKDVRT